MLGCYMGGLSVAEVLVMCDAEPVETLVGCLAYFLEPTDEVSHPDGQVRQMRDYSNATFHVPFILLIGGGKGRKYRQCSSPKKSKNMTHYSGRPWDRVCMEAQKLQFMPRGGNPQ